MGPVDSVAIDHAVNTLIEAIQAAAFPKLDSNPEKHVSFAVRKFSDDLFIKPCRLMRSLPMVFVRNEKEIKQRSASCKENFF